jgi:hypothetical protein
MNTLRFGALFILLLVLAGTVHAAPSPVATLGLAPAETLPGLPVAFVVTIHNPTSERMTIWPTARLTVVGPAETFDAKDIAQRPDVQIAGQDWEKCEGLRCVHIEAGGQGQIYVDYGSALSANEFFFDRRLSPPATYDLRLTLRVSLGDSVGPPLQTNIARLTVKTPTGADAAVWQRMQELAGPGGWGAFEWANLGKTFANEIRTQHSGSAYALWTVAMTSAATTDEMLGRLSAAIDAHPTPSLRDTLLFTKASLAHGASTHEEDIERNADRAVAYAGIAREAYTTVQQNAIAEGLRRRAAAELPHLYTRQMAEDDLRLLSSLDSPAPAKIVPRVDCVTLTADGRFTARFGYTNPNAANKALGIGDLNQVTPAPRDRGQPRSFQVGDHIAFEVPATEEKITWRLDGGTAVATAKFATRCEVTPPRKKVVPFTTCSAGTGGSKVMRFGYDNPNAADVQIAVGDQNHFDPAPAGRGQPTTFTPGHHEGVVVITRSPGDIRVVWKVDGTESPSGAEREGCN